MRKLPLGNFLLSAQAGVACGIRDDSGVAQLRLNNLLTNGSIDFNGHIRIPSELVPDEMLLRQGDVLFNNTNSVELVGKTVYFDGYNEKVTFSNHVTRLRVKIDELSPEYLALWLQHQWRSKVFEGICDRWIGQAAVQKGKLEALEIPAPALGEQRQIADRLKAQLAEVETARQAVQVQMNDIALLRNRVVAEAFIATDNEPTSLGTVIRDIQAGKSFQTTEILARPDELGVLKVSAVSWSNFRPKEAKALKDDYQPAAHHRVSKGDFVISRANTKELVGAVVLVEHDYPYRLLSDKTLRLVIDEERASKEYLLYALRAPIARKHIEHFATGTSDSMRNISQGVITSIPIVLPDLQAQIHIATKLKAQLDEINSLETANKTALADLSQLPQHLLTQAFQR